MYEKAKEYLKQYQNAKIELQTLYEERAELYSILDVGSIPLESDGSAKGYSDTHKREHIHSLLADIDVDIDKRKLELMRILHKVVATMRKVNDKTLQRLLFMRYVKDEMWERIAIELGYSYRHIHELHSKALESVNNLLEYHK